MRACRSRYEQDNNLTMLERQFTIQQTGSSIPKVAIGLPSQELSKVRSSGTEEAKAEGRERVHAKVHGNHQAKTYNLLPSHTPATRIIETSVEAMGSYYPTRK
ncbi:hypothetical protein A6R68_22828 [Neotoma lepida]|uniref:Uncharacterized protein n=1 Tax=Neotoma lepida TaxID=56216 RepID=A0A1A6HZL2_NEOLE|nr:hypothetical protein A6R68_22828 [Neotoma lepida]